MAELDFPFSDLVAGYVTARDGDLIHLRTIDGRPATVRLLDIASAQFIRNPDRPYADASGKLDDLLVPGQFVFSYGPVYPAADGLRVCSSALTFTGEEPGHHLFESPGWWIQQIREIAAFYRRAQFGTGEVDFADYRTELRLGGDKTARHVQETDTMSRLIYGMSTAYMLTGETDYLVVAERGSDYLREHLRFVDTEEDVVYWYHGIDVEGFRERKLFASEFGDDYRAIPAYEQIYALVGLVQTYRVTGDPRILADVEATVRLFDRFFADPVAGGYFSHVDPVELDPHHPGLGPNRSRKNWNSIGDHAPAYLINLYLATGQEKYLRMLEHTFDLIVSYFPDRTPGASPFVRERFHGDWSVDAAWGWQLDRAVVGHNLKIVWNLTRMNAVLAKYEYQQLARTLAEAMPAVGRDGRRGGWYDMVQRVAADGRHEFVWHDRKAWWQQEQAILAYQILAAHTGDEDAARHAREAAAFYNAFFLDHDEGAVYFNVLANGVPYLTGTERLKGSHAMSMYHSAELCYLSTIYSGLLSEGEPLDLWFRPRADRSYPGGLLRVAPDLMPAGRVVLDSVLVDGEPYSDFDREAMAVRLPDSASDLTVQVRLCPTRTDQEDHK
jgi:mannose/cellobiose epimerase-like protein (N-acyl-D-glucosamine 2-epimerase family)